VKYLIAALSLCISVAAYGQDEINVIVGFNGKADEATFARHGGKTKTTNESLNFVAGEISAAAVAHLKKEAGVAYVEENHTAYAVDYPANWGYVRVRAASASTTGTTSDGTRIKVAVCDTGVDVNHPALVGQAVLGANFSGASDLDVVGHGTHVSGIIAGTNNTTVTGVAVGAQVVSVKVLGDDGSGSYAAIINGITWATANGCKVINLSLGGRFGSTTLQKALNDANGVVVCAAAGNDGTKNASYPAYYEKCIAVCASDTTKPSDPLTGTDRRASFSNYGTWCDVSAPGVNIWSSLPGGAYASWNGTSMATPFVSGTAALVWAKYPGASDSVIRSKIVSTIGPAVDSKRYTPGVINAQKATE